MVGRHARADEAERRGQPVEQVDRHRPLGGEQMARGVEAGRTRADYRDAQCLFGGHAVLDPAGIYEEVWEELRLAGALTVGGKVRDALLGEYVLDDGSVACELAGRAPEDDRGGVGDDLRRARARHALFAAEEVLDRRRRDRGE